MGRPRKQPLERMRIHWACVIVIALWFVLAAVFPWRSGAPAAGEFYTMGQWFTRHFGTAALFACAFFFLFGRSSRAANIAFGIVLTLMMVPMAARVTIGAANEQRREHLADIASEMRARVASSLETIDEPIDPASYESEWITFAAQAEAMSASLKGEDRSATRALAALYREIGQSETAYLRSAGAFVETNPYEFSGIGSREELSERLAGAEEAAEAARLHAAVFDGATGRFRQLLAARSVSSEFTEKIVGVFQHRSAPTLRAALVRTDEAFHEAGADMIRFLIEHWGRWEVDTEHGWEVFEEGIDDEPYAEAIARFNAAIDEDERLSAELIARVRENMQALEGFEGRLRGR